MSRELLKRAAVVLREVWDNDDCYCAPSVIKLQKEIVAYLAQPELDPVLLNEDEINEMVCDYSQTNIWEFARSIEQAVLKANGFKVGE
jgi:hypothetical protein